MLVRGVAVSVQPDDGLSAEAQAVRYELEAYARLNPNAPATVLVWHLARRYIPGWLKKPRWWWR